jgi:hypothetical protein
MRHGCGKGGEGKVKTEFKCGNCETKKRGRGRPPAKPSTIEVMRDGTVLVHLNGSGNSALIDKEDIPTVCSIPWYLRKTGSRKYAACSGTYGGKMMHQIIMPEVPQIDHQDGNGLNNRRSNLRPCTPLQNLQNRLKCSKPCSSRYKGVRFRAKRWESSIMAKGVRRHLGRFLSEEQAALAYDAAARELHGEFARLNFPAGILHTQEGA